MATVEKALVSRLVRAIPLELRKRIYNDLSGEFFYHYCPHHESTTGAFSQYRCFEAGSLIALLPYPRMPLDKFRCPPPYESISPLFYYEEDLFVDALLVILKDRHFRIWTEDLEMGIHDVYRRLIGGIWKRMTCARSIGSLLVWKVDRASTQLYIIFS